jgi:DNA-binding GntR family transcriptional regulator
VQEVWEIEQLCELVEPFAARRAAGRIPKDVLEEIKSSMDASDTEWPGREEIIEYMKLDVRLHAAILDAAGNMTMRDMITLLHRRMNAVRIVGNTHRFTESIEEHRRIIAALEMGDGDAASEAMRHHIRQRMVRQRYGSSGFPVE